MLEVEKYEKAWDFPDYRLYSSGEESVFEFLTIAEPKQGESIIDFGCGTGRAAKRLKEAGLSVTALDFAHNAMNDDVDVPFVQADLTKPIPIKAKWGFCADVMEHIPTDDVPTVLRNILGAVDACFFKIAKFKDHFGPEIIGEPMHLTVENLGWWQDTIKSVGGNVISGSEDDSYASIYVSSWHKTKLEGYLNIDLEQARENIRINSAKGYATVVAHPMQDVDVMLLGGGPSLAEFEDDIRAKREAGMPLVTTNGAYKWCLDRGIKPSAQVLVDGRGFNRRFVEPVIEDCKYLISSQCDPAVLESLPKDQVYLWHAISQKKTMLDIEEIVGEKIYPIPGGSTVVLRAIPLLRTLGFPRFHIYGFDSCVFDHHHSYDQPENNQDIVIPVRVAGEEFMASPWMISQAQEFQVLAKTMDRETKLAVYGDGLIATILRKAAELSRD